jgi:hypothetical protein
MQREKERQKEQSILELWANLIMEQNIYELQQTEAHINECKIKSVLEYQKKKREGRRMSRILKGYRDTKLQLQMLRKKPKKFAPRRISFKLQEAKDKAKILNEK